MSQVQPEGDAQSTTIEDDLDKWLQRNKLSKLYSALVDDGIDMVELLTYTEEDVIDWCNEHKISVAIRRRFLNSLKKLPNSSTTKENSEQRKQIKEFNEMTNNLRKLIQNINQNEEIITTRSQPAVTEVNKLCEQLQRKVESIRVDVTSKIENKKDNKLNELKDYLKQCRQLVVKMNHTKEDYVTSLDKGINIRNSGSNEDENKTINTNELKEQIVQCKEDNKRLLSKQRNVMQLFEYKINSRNIMIGVEREMKTMVSTLITEKKEKEKEKEKEDVYDTKVCQFNKKLTQMGYYQLSCDARHIQLTSEADFPFITLFDENGFKWNKNGKNLSDNQYCFRMYYDAPYNSKFKVQAFGVYSFNVDPKTQKPEKAGRTNWSFYHKHFYGILGDSTGYWYKGGVESSTYNMRYLYENARDQIDMMIDLNGDSENKSCLVYRLVRDDNIKYAKKDFKITGLAPNVTWIPHFSFLLKYSQLQVAQIPVSLFGKNESLVDWPG